MKVSVDKTVCPPHRLTELREWIDETLASLPEESRECADLVACSDSWGDTYHRLEYLRNPTEEDNRKREIEEAFARKNELATLARLKAKYERSEP